MTKPDPTSVRAFIFAFSASWLTRMSGPLSVLITVFGLWASEPITKAAFGGIGVVALIVSSYLVWKAERIKVLELEAKFPDGFEHHFANVRVADAPSVVSLFNGPERAKLMTLLTGGLMPTWARPNSVLRHDLVPLPLSVWQTYTFNFYPKGDEPGHISQTFLKPSLSIHDGDYFDLCMNKAQLLRAWPDLDIPESKCDVL